MRVQGTSAKSVRKAVDRPAEKVFYSYSHKDEGLRDRLSAHLAALQHTGLIIGWHDRKITAGQRWMSEIDRHLESASVVLLLVSSDFIDSQYCYGEEMKRALARDKAGEAIVIPIILRDCLWKATPLGNLQALPKDGKPITLWPDQDAAFANVAEGVKIAIEERLRSSGRQATPQPPKLLPEKALHPAPVAKVTTEPAQSTVPVKTRRRTSSATVARLTAAAETMIPASRTSNSAILHLVTVPDCSESLLRPSELEASGLEEQVTRDAEYGKNAVLDRRAETWSEIRDGALWISQKDRSVCIHESGSVAITWPAESSDRRTMVRPVIIEEDVRDSLARALRFTAWVLNKIDRKKRCEFVVICAGLVGANYTPWRTRAEHEAEPNRMALPSRPDRIVVRATPALQPRTGLQASATKLSADLAILLKRSQK